MAGSRPLLVSTPERADRPGAGHELDVRVDDHADPLGELRRLAGLGMAYRDVDRAERHLVAGEIADAAAIYDEVLTAHADHDEFRFWAGMSLTAAGEVDRGRQTIEPVLTGDDGERWRELLRRLPKARLFEQSVADHLLD